MIIFENSLFLANEVFSATRTKFTHYAGGSMPNEIPAALVQYNGYVSARLPIVSLMKKTKVSSAAIASQSYFKLHVAKLFQTSRRKAISNFTSQSY